MYEISNGRLEKLVDDFCNVLSYEGYGYDEQVVSCMVRDWLNGKSRLLEILSKHPNWVEDKFMIQFDQDYTREICTDEIKEFSRWLFGKLTYEERNEKQKVIKFIYNLKAQFIDQSYDNTINELNDINPDYHLRNNMKTSKLIGKICREEGWDKFEDYNRRYAAVCDCLNPIKVKRHTCISLNPIDFLYMSNGSSWKSCHDIRDASDPGCYSAGTISYMLDENSFIFYTVDSNFNGTDIEYQPKVQRQIFGYRDFVLFQSRLYPQSNDHLSTQIYKDIREIVKKIISDCINEANLWVTTKDDVEDYVKLGFNALCFPDWEYCNPGATHCRISKLKGKDTSGVRIEMGAETYCIKCGAQNENNESISCCKGVRCSECGALIDDDDAIWINGDPYCRDCVEYCDHCESYHVGGSYETEDGLVCADCYELYYSVCECCGEAMRNDRIIETDDGYYLCEECINNNTTVCEECGDVFYRDDNIHYDDVTKCNYCNYCYEHLIETRNEEMSEEE